MLLAMDANITIGLAALVATVALGGVGLLVAIRGVHWDKRGAMAAEETLARDETVPEVETSLQKSWVLTREGNDRTIFGIRASLWNKSKVPDVIRALEVLFDGASYRSDRNSLLVYRDEGPRRPYANLPTALASGDVLTLWIEFKVPGRVGAVGDHLPAQLTIDMGVANPAPIDFLIDVQM